MPQATDNLEPIITRDLASAAHTVIEHARQETAYPFLLDTKLGQADSQPKTDKELASAHDIPASTVSYRWTLVTAAIAKADGERGNPLGLIAQRANDFMAAAAIINRHRRHPPVYSDDTIRAFVRLGLADPEHLPLIRAAGHVSPPPVVPPNHDVDFVIGDIAAHMARSHEPETPEQVLQAVQHRKQELDLWPQLDITLFIHRMTDIRPGPTGCYHADQPWGTVLSAKQLVANTMLRILKREQKPLATKFLASETESLVGRFLPNGYNTSKAIRAAAHASDEVSRQGMRTLGLRQWTNIPEPQVSAIRPGLTGNLAYAFLAQNGPADVADVFDYVQRTSQGKKRTVQQAINHDPADRFIRISTHRVAANPVPLGHNPRSPRLTVVADGHDHTPPPVLRESELVWLTRYVEALENVAPPLPCRVAITGARAAGFALDDPVKIAVVVASRDRPNLESRLAEIAAAASEAVPSVQPQISILSVGQWAERMDGATPEPHHNIWLAPGSSTRRNGV